MAVFQYRHHGAAAGILFLGGPEVEARESGECESGWVGCDVFVSRGEDIQFRGGVFQSEEHAGGVV